MFLLNKNKNNNFAFVIIYVLLHKYYILKGFLFKKEIHVFLGYWKTKSFCGRITGKSYLFHLFDAP